MDMKVDIAVIGAGSAGITAFKEAWKKVKNIVLIHHGPHGTTCARVGCMPSKAFLRIAGEYYKRREFPAMGITGSSGLGVSIPLVMKRVRELRDNFVSGVLKTIDEIGERNIPGFARFLEPGVLEIDGKTKIKAGKIIIAAGAEPVIPQHWAGPGYDILSTDTFFEQDDLPASMGVIGLGAIGLELGQAMARLGIDVTGINGTDFIGGLTDPVVNSEAVKLFSDEMKIHLRMMADIKKSNGSMEMSLNGRNVKAGKILLSMGRRPGIKDLELERAGIILNKRGLPEYNPQTMKIEGYPIFIAGDINGDRPFLHEALDEGRIAGYNAAREKPVCFSRRAPLAITFTEPNIASVGRRFSEFQKEEIIIGEARFETQGRSIILGQNMGVIRIYGSPGDGKILGTEMIAPGGEHIAHLMAWAMQAGMNVFDLLAMPFYHPVVEEGLQNALKNLASKVMGPRPENELMRCEGHPSGL